MPVSILRDTAQGKPPHGRPMSLARYHRMATVLDPSFRAVGDKAHLAALDTGWFTLYWNRHCLPQQSDPLGLFDAKI